MNIVHTAAAPQAIGPYSQAVVANGFVFCSGQIALDAEGHFHPGYPRDQTRQVLHNLATVLEAAGSSLSKVVKTTVYLQSMDDFAEVNEVYAEIFGDHAPARATVQVARLPRDVAVEIDAIATL